MTDGAVLAIGELLWDLLPDGAMLGGAPANFANRVRQFRDAVGLVSRVGSDELGRKATDQLAKQGLPVDLIQLDPVHSTGTVDVRLSADGSPSFRINPDVAYDYLELTPALEAAVESAGLIYFGTLAQRQFVTRAALYQLLDTVPHLPRFLDINLRAECFSAETVEASLRRATILKLNQDEVGRLNSLLSLGTDDVLQFCQQIFDRFPIQSVLVTLGAGGALLVPRQGDPIYEPGLRVKVSDTIGAGDAFAAGFVVKQQQGAPAAKCLAFANALGSASAMVKGGMGVLTSEQVEMVMKTDIERTTLPQFASYRR